MFITENQKLVESILFLLSARESLSYMVENSSIEHKDELKTFLMNEASDYEIMHILMREEMPDKKYNFVDEVRLFSDLKEQVLINLNTLYTYMGESINTFIDEVDLIYPKFSSAAPILEFQLQSHNTKVLVEEVDLERNMQVLGREGREAIAKEIATPVKKAGPELIAAFKAKDTAASPVIEKAVRSPELMDSRLTEFLSVLALYASIKLYKRFMTKAGRTCKGKSGRDKQICVLNFQYDAISAQIRNLESAIKVCSKTKNPDKCKIPIQTKIMKLKKKMQKIKSKMG